MYATKSLCQGTQRGNCDGLPLMAVMQVRRGVCVGSLSAADRPWKILWFWVYPTLLSLTVCMTHSTQIFSQAAGCQTSRLHASQRGGQTMYGY
jgi:hypothetical protein